MKNDSTDSLVGTRIREYEILNVIGKGGMGAVYRARHVYLDEERAIKVIHAPLADQDSPFVDRFIREAKILTKLRHPDLVELYEFGRLDEKMFFMVMELMKGESVHERLKRLGRIPLADSLRITREAAIGLHVAHQRGIVHRDISPDNLMLLKLESGVEITKVIDFGIAKPTYQETHRYTIGEIFMGKPEFSSPEQCGFHEEGEEIDKRADIYSLAITLYYMLSGKLPFYSATPQGYLVKHASEPPKPLTVHFSPGEMPEAVVKLIEKALSKKRDQRHSTMAEFAEEIVRIESLSNPPESFLPTQSTSGEFKPGTLFARRYEIEKKVGRGGMGVVYKATDKFLDIPVALKTMNPDIADDQRTLSRLKREVILARKISHPNVCRIYDIGESDGIHYVSMDFLEGRLLSEILLKEGAMPLSDALLAAKQILDAVEAAHSAGVHHRDLKPQNIIIDPKGKAHIMDFGISTSADVSRLTQTGGLVGTPRYMAPEQFGPGKADHRADMYSIGIILFEMITGALPYEANTPATVMYAHLHTPPKRPTELISDLPLALESAILKALEKDPANRFQSIHEFRSALEPLLKPLATSATTLNQPSSFPLQNADPEVEEPTSFDFPPIKHERPVTVTKPQEAPPELSTIVHQDMPVETATKPSVRRADPVAMTTPDRSDRGLKESKSPKMLLIGGGIAATILIALAIWFFSGSEPKSQVVTKTEPKQETPKPAAPIQNPPAQEIPKEVVPAQVEEKIESPPVAEPSVTEPPQAEPIPVELPVVETPVVEPPKIETAVPSGGPEYTVEVMATSYKNRAEEKNSELNGAGYSSFVGENREGSNKYRVRVGRYNSYAAAKEMSNRLKSELKVEAWIVTLPKASPEAIIPEKSSPPVVTPAQPAAPTTGTISFAGQFPVTVFNGKELVMDTSRNKSKSLKPGKYNFTVNVRDKALIGNFNQSVEVKPGENTVIPAPAIGYLTINADPANCRITIDEDYQVAAPIQDLPVLVGKHRIFAEWRDLEIEEEITIQIGENKKTNLKAFVTGETVGIKEE